MTKKNIGKIITLFISKKDQKQRVKKDEISLDSLGVKDDKFYNTDIQRSVLITSISSYELAKSKGIDMSYGALGENLLIDYNPYSLEIGTQLKIGEVILEISQECTLCNHLSKIDKAVPKLLRNDRGIFAKVINSGSIKIEDKLYII
jgi:MOSC domain-containing protein YiiM